MLGAGLMADSPLLVALGSPFGGIGSVWFSVLVGLALVKLGTKRSMVVIPTAFVAKYAVQFGLVLMGDALDLLAALVLYFACTTASYLLIRPRVHRMITAIRESASPTVLDATNPSSFLPFSSLVYVSVFLFNAACGYAFGSQGQMMPQAATLLSFVPVVVVFFIVVAARAVLSPMRCTAFRRCSCSRDFCWCRYRSTVSTGPPGSTCQACCCMPGRTASACSPTT